MLHDFDLTPKQNNNADLFVGELNISRMSETTIIPPNFGFFAVNKSHEKFPGDCHNCNVLPAVRNLC